MRAGCGYAGWGVMAIQIGRKRESARAIVLGVLLLGLTFVVGSTWWAWLLAVVMSVGCFWP